MEAVSEELRVKYIDAIRAELVDLCGDLRSLDVVEAEGEPAAAGNGITTTTESETGYSIDR